MAAGDLLARTGGSRDVEGDSRPLRGLQPERDRGRLLRRSQGGDGTREMGRRGRPWISTGHAGTLDPLAEGVLVVGIDRETTKKVGIEVKKEKEYLAKIKLGETRRNGR